MSNYGYYIFTGSGAQENKEDNTMAKKDLIKRSDYAPTGGSHLVSRFHDAVDDMFSRFWDDFPSFDMKLFDEIQPTRSKFPAVDVYSTEEGFQVDIAVAGFNKDDVELELKDNTLFIKADSNTECEDSDEKGTCLKKEIARRSFRRAIRFPEKIDSDQVEASYKDGVISCSVGKVVPEELEDGTVKIQIN
jgi:molecular chaperone IbpA